jgi:chromosome segregation ATPase
MPGENILQSLQKLVTIAQRLDSLSQRIDELQKTAYARLDRLEDHVLDIRERLARLEAARDGDRAQMQADLALFKLEVERAALRFGRRRQPPGEPPALPGQPDEEA